MQNSLSGKREQPAIEVGGVEGWFGGGGFGVFFAGFFFVGFLWFFSFLLPDFSNHCLFFRIK